MRQPNYFPRMAHHAESTPDAQPPKTIPYGRPAPGFRLPAELTLGMVTLQVGDLERSMAWYTEVLGLTCLQASAGAQVMGTPDGTPLVRLVERAGARPVRPGTRLGLYHVALLVPDRAALGRCLGHLAQRGEPVGASDHWVSEALYLTDPDGLGFEVYADRPRDSWQVQEHELLMATDPLDVRSVLADAGAASWTGLPDGTRVGHLHLHVGELARARHFYSDALGFDQMVWRYPGALFLAAGGYHHHLGTNTWARGAAPPAADEAQLLEWTILLPATAAVRAAAESLTAQGYAVEWRAETLHCRDPWGTCLQLLAAA